MICSMEGFTFATVLDLSIVYYHIRLYADGSRSMNNYFHMINGKYKYKRSPMGIKIAPDVFQNLISKLVQDMECDKTTIISL
jgi:hypothetical protein